MSRRFRYTFILVLVAVGTCLAALGGWRYARASAPVNGPIVLISIDSLRADRLGAYGYQQSKTPAIDTLAKDGVVFERAYSHVPETLPSHAAILTGRLPFETGVRDGVGLALPAAERTLAEMLRDRGYATGGVVSSFLLRRDTGIDQGFTFFDGDLSKEPDAAADTAEPLQRGGGESEQVAEKWLASIGTTRAFLFLHLDDPRGSAADRNEGNTAYNDRVAQADQAVGRLVRYLKAHQLYDQTTVILTSDHGEALSDHGEQGHALLVYDSTLRVPLIIKQAAGEAAGQRVKTPVQLIDLAPTVLDFAKAPRPGNLRGRSLTPLLDREDGSISEASIYSESLFGLNHFGWSQLTSIVDGQYHYIEGVTPELYDVEADPDELQNLIDARKDVATALHEKLARLTATLPADVKFEAPSLLARERYDALGYVGSPAQPTAPHSELADPKQGVDLVEQYRAGVALAHSGNVASAIDHFRAIVRKAPEMEDVWLALGDLAARIERWDAALDAYKRAAQLEAPGGEASLGAASALLHMKRYDEAAQQARRIFEGTIPRPALTASAHEMLARIALGRRDPDLALSEAELAEASGSRPVKGYVEGRIAFDQGRFADALASFEPALTAMGKSPEPPLADLRLYTAESLVRLNRWTDAEPLLLLEMEKAPSARARNGLAAVYRATGRGSEAASLAHH